MRNSSLKPITAAWRLRAGSLVFATLMLLMPASPVLAQRNGVGQNFPPRQMSDPMSPMAGDPATSQMRAKRLDALNTERQKSLVADTNKLLKLTAELNAQINGTHPARLTQDQLKMVAQIEKLAHSVREKMSSPVNGAQDVGPQPAPMIMPPNMPLGPR